MTEKLCEDCGRPNPEKVKIENADYELCIFCTELRYLKEKELTKNKIESKLSQ
jgi:ribosome-binding protein aMBF1 (putative translation factor)